MSSGKTSLVVGAGIGGITAAALLARNGYDVTVIEKNSIPGGRCNQLVREGHRFDIGPTLLLMPVVFRETYRMLGEELEDHLDLRRVEPTYQTYFDDGSQLTHTPDLGMMQSQLESIESGSFGAYLRYLAKGHDYYHQTLQHLVSRNFYSFLEYFSLKNVPLLIKLGALTKHFDFIERYFRHPNLKAAFTFQDMYLGLSPFDAPATYSLLQYTEAADGVWFPMGGMYRIIESLVSIAQKLGVRFIYDAPVKQITLNGNKATGVILQDGSHRSADLLVANADLPYVYRQLLPDKVEATRLERLNYTCSAIMFYWGVDKKYPQLDVHNLFMAGDFRASCDSVFKDHSLPSEPNFYVHAPSRSDPFAAPAGQDTLMVLVPAGRLDEKIDQDWDGIQSQARRAVLSRLAEIGLTDLEDHLKFEVCYTPRTWRSNFNVVRGAAFGSLSHNVSQVGYLRPKNRHGRYRNLYFVGGSTHPGNGLPLALLSARLTTERILKEASVARSIPVIESESRFRYLPTNPQSEQH
jgi:phytoene desaturase